MEQDKLALRLNEIIWRERFATKIAEKHKVTIDEIEQVLFSKPHIGRAERGRVKGENLYVAYGGQTQAGRYLVIFFILKRRTAALPITARDMSESERGYHHAQKEAH